jgi:hypothetical protein
MCRLHFALAVLVLLGVAGTAGAIPPPWTLEEAKGNADLVLIAKMAEVSPVEGIRGADHKVSLKPVQVLKGDLTVGEDTPNMFLLFTKPQPRVGPGGIRAHVVGGTGHPVPVEGESALVFLRKAEPERHYSIVCGKFGYVSLSSSNPQQLAEVTKRLNLYRGWCERIEDANIRKAMTGYYDRVLSLLAERD